MCVCVCVCVRACSRVLMFSAWSNKYNKYYTLTEKVSGIQSPWKMLMKEEIRPRCSHTTTVLEVITIARKHSHLKSCGGPVLVHSAIDCFVIGNGIHEHVL